MDNRGHSWTTVDDYEHSLLFANVHKCPRLLIRLSIEENFYKALVDII